MSFDPHASRIRSSRAPLVGALLLLALVVFAASSWLVDAQQRSVEGERKRYLEAVAETKSNQIGAWFAERKRYAESLKRDQHLGHSVARWLAAGAPAGEARNQLRDRIAWIGSAFGAADVELIDADGRSRLQWGPSSASYDAALVAQALATGEVGVSEMHDTPEHPDVATELDIIAPLSTGAGPPAAVRLHFAVAAQLGRVIGEWPLPGVPGEIALLQRRGDVGYLLVAGAVATGPQRLPVDRPDLIEARALANGEGLLHGERHGGGRSIGVVRDVAGTDWRLLVQVDEAGLEAALRRYLWIYGGLALLAVLIAGGVALLFGRTRAASDRAARLQAELARERLAARVDLLSRHASDIILLTDAGGRIVDANERAATAYGVPFGSLLGCGMDVFRAEPEPEPAPDAAATEAGRLYETRHRRSDGSSFPVEVNSRRVAVGDQQLTLSVIRDISERRRRDDLIREVALGVGGGIGEGFFHSLVRHLARALHLQTCLVGEIGEDGTSVSVIAAWHQGAPAPNIRYQLAGTPCAEVSSGRACVYPDRVQQRFPDDTLLGELGAESYAGVPLRGGRDQVVGLLAVLGAEPIGRQDEVATVLRIFSGRAAAEIERRRADAELRLSAQVFEGSGEAILITDAHNCIVNVNRAFTEITGYSREEVLGKNPHILGAGRHDKQFFRGMWASIRETGRWAGENWNRRKNGEVYPQWLSISAVCDAAGHPTHYVGIASDITERKSAEERIQFMAHYDALTGLPNRSLLDDRLRQAISVARRKRQMLAVLFMDLDRFKNVNDSLGHHIGDELLRVVGERLQGALRESDTVCRRGGDEFVILMPELHNASDAAGMAAKLVASLAEPMTIEGFELSITPSVGISLFPEDGDDADTLVRNADAAMYHAKDQGRNNYQFFTPALNTQAMERMTLEHRLRRALERGEFLLYYQPQIDGRSGALVGLEALLRWRHPEHGVLDPGRFIAVAEQSGLIVPVGLWVLGEACRQAMLWQQAGAPAVRVAVNLSSLQFRDQSLVNHVRGALAASGLEASLLELELTETVIMSDAEAVIATLRRLKSLGVKLAVDDFGTGYSSLSYLKRFPIDRLKIDRSFVADLPHDSEDGSITEAIVNLAHSLSLEVIAEGVETDAQRDFLIDKGCPLMQGYLFSRPVPAAEIAAHYWPDASTATTH